MFHFLPVTIKCCSDRHCHRQHFANDLRSKPHHLPKLRDWVADFREPSVLDRLSRGVKVVKPYHLSRQVCENCHHLPLRRTLLHVLRSHPRRLPRHVGKVAEDRSSLESTYCEDQLS